MKIFKRLLALPAILIAFSAAAQGTQGEIKVTVKNELKEEIPGAAVSILVSEKQTQGAATDMNGVKFFRAMDPGKYDIKVVMTGYKAYVKKNVEVTAGKTSYVEFDMQPVVLLGDTGVVIYANYYKDLIDKDFTTASGMNYLQIKNSVAPPGDIQAMALSVCSSCSETKDRQLVMRGSRPGASQMFVDGEKLYGSTAVPGLSIEQFSAISGGIPAEFGDVTGGVIIVTTRSYFSGIKDKQTRMEILAEEAAKAKAEKDKKAAGVEEVDGVLIEQAPTLPAKDPKGNGGGQ